MCSFPIHHYITLDLIPCSDIISSLVKKMLFCFIFFLCKLYSN